MEPRWWHLAKGQLDRSWRGPGYRRRALGRDADAHAGQNDNRRRSPDGREARRRQPGAESPLAGPRASDGVRDDARTKARSRTRPLELGIEGGLDLFVEIRHQVIPSGTSTAGFNPWAAR